LEAGQVCGLLQNGVGYVKGQPLIKLHMEAYLGAPESYDAVTHCRHATAQHDDRRRRPRRHRHLRRSRVNSIPKILDAKTGLRTMRDMALPLRWIEKRRERRERER
jgi:hypothetical protein